MDTSSIAIAISLVSAVFAGIVAVKKSKSDAAVAEARVLSETKVAETKAAMEAQLAILEAQGRIALNNSSEIRKLKDSHEDCEKRHDECEKKYALLQSRVENVEEKINNPR